MPVRFEMEMGESPEEGSDRIVGSWTFYCGSCNSLRKAIMFGSGHVFDVLPDQGPEIEHLERVQKGGQEFFKNLYFVPEVGVDEIRETQGGIEAVKLSIAHAHAEQFHGITGSGRIRIVGKN